MGLFREFVKGSKMSTKCNYASKLTDEDMVICTLGLCADGELDSCCNSCESYEGPSRGLGDRVANLTKAVGIKPCGGCQKRREALNKMTDTILGKKADSDDS